MGIEILNKENLQKLFYFSLKKTGNHHEAEELVQETSLEMLKMLKRGYKPDNFNAWMWTVIRKRYARWCKNKHIALSRYGINDVFEYGGDIASEENFEEEIIAKDEIWHLHNELALMSSDYRNIVVLYYFQNKKIAEISEITGLPEGTIMRKLFEARKNIKEGMKMARTKGQRSFAPEDVSFDISSNKVSANLNYGGPGNLFRGLAAKNIALEAYNNPSSVEELSLALGIAAPYIEDMLKDLLDTEVIVKNNGKIETNFIIIDKETQELINNFYEEVYNSFCSLVCGFIGKNLDKILNIGFVNHDMPKEYIYWSLLYLTIERMLIRKSESLNTWYGHTKRPNGDMWDIMGYEHWDNPLRSGFASSSDRNWQGNSFFDKFKISFDDLLTNEPRYSMPSDGLALLTDIIRNNRTKPSLDVLESKIADSLAQNKVITFTGDMIKIDFPVFDESQNRQFSALCDIIDDESLYAEWENIYNKTYEILMKSVPARLADKAKAATINNICGFRIIIMHYAYHNGIIKIPEGDNKSAINMYMKI
ncbi:MAG: sigma-70 family RNA polymerase sigma factor [Oscillospiraceae bacterium]|nr:sigma-70 family RNA polymerase sigma factor [Oscillospiraceae bacterium]